MEPVIDHIYDPKYFKELEVAIDRHEGVLWLRMMPQGRGCFTHGLLKELKRYQQGLLKWEGYYPSGNTMCQIRYEVLTSGLDGVFNYGGDLNFFLQAIKDNDRESLLSYGIACIDVVHPNAINYNLPVCTISLVTGDALGGGLEAALSSSIVIAESGVQMGFPEILFGLFPGMGAYSLLVRRVTPSLAKRIITGGKVYTSEEFLELGVIDYVVERGSGVNEVRSLIARHMKHHGGYCAIDKVVQSENPVSYNEMYSVVELWVETALNLSQKELRVMERLARAQKEKGVPEAENYLDADGVSRKA